MVIVIGGINALFLALIAMVVYDIKRVIAYSTLSQLGYMAVALGASAYPAAMFHLFTHAFFKGLFFLAAGSVIIGMHHEQDMRRMGGLRKYMPITYVLTIIAAAANAALPPFAGFFSKDTIIDAARLAQVPGGTFAYLCVLACSFVTAFYSFRLVFYTFHGEERFRQPAPHGHGDHGHDDHGHGHDPHESPWVVTVPLILLAIPSVCAGWLIGRIVYGDYFGDAIVIAAAHPALAELAREYHGVVAMMTHAFFTAPFWLAVAGLASTFYLYVVRPDLPGVLRARLGLLVRILENKYGFDELYQKLFGDGAVKVGTGLWKGGDVTVIDGVLVDGSAKTVGAIARLVRLFQTGFIYQYAFTMIIGLFVLLSLWLYRIAFPG
jgi:NADH-quinone oxidoreductase subunit L